MQMLIQPLIEMVQNQYLPGLGNRLLYRVKLLCDVEAGTACLDSILLMIPTI